jgi:hypothetical protein
MSKTVTPLDLALILLNAVPNLFGSILVRKKIDIRKSEVANASQNIKGNLYKEYVIKGFATLKDYEVAVNNAKERNEQERSFDTQERKWGRHWQGSPIVIEHNGRFYIQIRLTKKSIGQSVFVDSMGNKYEYEDIEKYLLSKDKRETKHRSKVATAERQGLEVEESVQVRDIPLDTIVSLAYAKEVYEVIPEAVGSKAVPFIEEEDENEEVQEA